MDASSRNVRLAQHARDEIGLAFGLDKDQGALVRLGDAGDQFFKLVTLHRLVVLDAQDMASAVVALQCFATVSQ